MLRCKKSVMIQRSKKSEKFVIRKTWNCWRYEEQCVVRLEPHFCLNMFFFSFAQTNQKQDEFIRPVKVCKLSIIDSLRVKDFGEHQRTNRRSLLNGHFVSLLFKCNKKVLKMIGRLLFVCFVIVINSRTNLNFNCMRGLSFISKFFPFSFFETSLPFSPFKIWPSIRQLLNIFLGIRQIDELNL